jgi:hypothetical protein
MNSFTAFRTSIIVAPIIALLALIYTTVAIPTFSQDWQDLLSWAGDGGVFVDGDEFSSSDIALLVGLIALTFVALGNQVALFFYWRPSRSIFLGLTILGFVATPFLGLTVAPPMETFGYELSIFISGMTLALAYFSPVAERFK